MAKHIDQLYAGPHIEGYQIYHNDHFHHLQINGRLVRLSPTEYKLCIYLLRHFERLQHFALYRREHPETNVPPVYVSFEQLQHCAQLAERSHVTKHLSNANGKLKVHGISILCVNEYGYTLDFQHPVLSSSYER
ncbi:hypothetical protein EI42_01689 [Thermosporothrix hazakensis]|uniref:Uncharacterized protein n=1 Tax=Thermosporothrix hazakensis TaxID=644383 RepID=A0A326UPT2_THEHA|nr:hypothetical protein [Thermosporothrix hazakensis]PZW32597.1 hypothetical protein EI42_01689 [Thermosporothrix hazakensis]GCE49951.1 hypothetical protein KTH_48200 [Thermosporothrix hazakensis]